MFLHIPRQSDTTGQSLLERIKKLDLLGASILVPAVVCLLLALQWGGATYPWRSAHIIGLFVGFAGLITIFIYTQYRLGDAATLPFRILSQRTVAAASVYALTFGAGFFVLVFYLPLYFQSVKGSSATHSGIQSLPLMLSAVISSILTGLLITIIGYYTPILIIGTVIFSIGAGLLTTFTIYTPFSHWFGYQVLAGLGLGVGFQTPILSVQTVLPLADVPIGTAIIIFFQALGGALFISIAQNVFQNGLIRGVHTFAPSVDPTSILRAGATEIRNVLARLDMSDQLEGVLRAYMVGLIDTFRVSVACTVVCVLAACFFELRSVKEEEVLRKKREAGDMALAV
jgi:hypothetical protein